MDKELQTREDYMRLALSQARLSPPKPTNFRVGAVVVDEDTNTVLATGYTLELPGNTHAEQCCFQKLAKKFGVSEDDIGAHLGPNTVIYTTMEPCSERLSGNLPCVDRITNTHNVQVGNGIKKVYSGVFEPDTFVKKNVGRGKLESANMEFVHIAGFEDEILEVATTGHTRPETEA